MHPCVLVPLDFSFDADRALPVATRWGRALEAKVRLLEIVPDRGAMSRAWSSLVRLTSTLTSFGVDMVPEVVVADDAADGILRAAGELTSPLVVIGAHDHAEHAHPALGHVSLAVVRHSPYPVLVVPAPQRGREI